MTKSMDFHRSRQTFGDDAVRVESALILSPWAEFIRGGISDWGVSAAAAQTPGVPTNRFDCFEMSAQILSRGKSQTRKLRRSLRD